MKVYVEPKFGNYYAAYNETGPVKLYGSGMTPADAIVDFEETIQNEIKILTRRKKPIPPELLEDNNYIILTEKRKRIPKTILGKILWILFG